MARKRYESPLFTAGLFAIILLGLVATALDPTGLVRGSGRVAMLESFSAVRLAFICLDLVMVLGGMVIRLVAIATLKGSFSGGAAH